MFQSSLELSPECNLLASLRSPQVQQVSILTRAFARVQRRAGWSHPIESQVSFLTRAFARVQRVSLRADHSPRSFQSSLELSPECNGSASGPTTPEARFNPHSSFRPSATKVGVVR